MYLEILYFILVYMVEYKCFRCGYVATQKCNLKNHLNRKNICKPILDNISIEEIKNFYKLETTLKQHPKCTQIAPKQHPNCTFLENELAPKMHLFAPFQQEMCTQNAPFCTQNRKNSNICKYCNKSFTRTTGLTKHLKICKKKQTEEMLTLTQSDKIMKMEKEIEELKNYKIQTQNNTTNNITTNNNINNSKNIYINNYGDENLKHLRTKDFASLLNGIYSAVPKLIEKIHFDPNHPENQNIKFTNRKLPYLKVMKDSKWQLVNKKHELLDLIDNKCFMLKEKYYAILEKNKYNITEAHKQKIDEFMDKYNEDDKKIMIDLIERTELMLLNNS